MFISLSRAAFILREVCASPDSLSLGQIALKTGLARATVQRIVNALEKENFVQAGAKGVRPGWGIRQLSDISVMCAEKTGGFNLVN